MASRIATIFTAVTIVATAAAAPYLNRGPATGSNLHKRTYRQGNCPNAQWGRFTVEESFAIGYADYVNNVDDLEDQHAFEEFIPSDYLDEDFVNTYKTTYLQPFAGLSQATDIEVTINCGNNQSVACTQTPPNAPAGQIAYAVTDSTTNTITLCDGFFTQPPSSSNNTAWCNDDDRTLGEFETGAFTLLHEFGHLDYTVDPRLVDNAWCGSGQVCADLAENDAASAIANADNWMFAAMGVYWEGTCGRDIPLE